MQTESGNNSEHASLHNETCNARSTDRFVECFRLCAESFRLFNQVVELLSALQDGFDRVVLAAKQQRNSDYSTTS